MDTHKALILKLSPSEDGTWTISRKQHIRIVFPHFQQVETLISEQERLKSLPILKNLLDSQLLIDDDDGHG